MVILLYIAFPKAVDAQSAIPQSLDPLYKVLIALLRLRLYLAGQLGGRLCRLLCGGQICLVQHGLPHGLVKGKGAFCAANGIQLCNAVRLKQPLQELLFFLLQCRRRQGRSHGLACRRVRARKPKGTDEIIGISGAEIAFASECLHQGADGEKKHHAETHGGKYQRCAAAVAEHTAPGHARQPAVAVAPFWDTAAAPGR